MDNAVKFSRDRHLPRIVVGKLEDGTIFFKANPIKELHFTSNWVKVQRINHGGY
jgi:hypothetical protein